MNKNNNKKGYISCIIVTTLISILAAVMFFTEESFTSPNHVYQIYLDGQKIGVIDNKEELYDLINEEQGEIKDTYSVDQVYPPKGFTIEKYTTYQENTTTVSEIYNKIKNEKDFTIKGYTITIKNKDENIAPKYIYILDKQVFEDAVYNFITTFVDETKYKQYLNGTQPEIIDVGEIINNMYFDETLTIKESYISVEEQIFTNATDLTKYLLFGNNNKEEKYKVAKGDTIETISDKHKLNVQEFMIANPAIQSQDTMLAIGQEVTISLINPQITLIYESEVTEDQTVPYEVEQKFDYSKNVGFKEVVQQGINGINRITKQIQVSNGEERQGAYIEEGKTQVIRETQNEIVNVGKKVIYTGSSGNISPNQGAYIETGASWAWPTNSPYVITSGYEWRWGAFHDGLDISGTGLGSPIYAVLDGEVVSAQWGGMVGSSSGLNVVIRHNNGYYSVYAHMNSLNVKQGDWVTRRQQIGTMGHTGWATGTHLHLSIFVGMPFNGGYSINPYKLWNMA